MSTTVLSVRLPDDLKRRLDELGSRTGRPTTFYVREAIESYIDDLEYAYALRAEAEAVRRAHAGLRTVDPQLANDLLFSGPNPLTAREQEVLRLARDGEPVAKLARKLFLSPGTVRNHLSNAIGKTGAANRVEAARIATERGWL